VRRRSVVLWLYGLCVLLALPFAASAQEEPEPVPFTQIVTSDGSITMAYPEGWAVDGESLDGSLVFRSDANSVSLSEGVTAAVSFVTSDGLAQAFLTGTTAAENAAQLRDAYIELFTGADGQLNADIGEVAVVPGAGNFPEIASFSVDANGQFGTIFVWQVTDGLYGTATVFTNPETWTDEEPVVLDMLRSVRYIGDAAVLEGGN
jgi:hypothetical protein